MHAAEVAQNLRDSSDVIADKGDSRRPFKVGIEDSPVRACCGTFHQGVLEHLVIGAGGAQLAAQGGEVADFEAAVLGENGRVGVREMLAYLFDDCDLLGLGPAMSAPLITSSGPGPVLRLRRDHGAHDVRSA